MASSKKANAKDKDAKPLSDAALRHNAAALEYCRTSVSAVSGSAAGVMGLTGFYGFAFYFITALMMSCMLYLKTGHWNRYFVSPYILLTGGLLGGLLTYLLCWTFLYGMVHVY